MIIKRAYYREVTQTSLVVTLIFASLFIVIALVSLLAKAATGRLPTQSIFLVLGLQTVRNLNVILPLALYLGILLTLSRWYRDSEMTVLNACGVSLKQLLGPTVAMAAWVALLVAGVSFYVSPMASAEIDRVKVKAASNQQSSDVSPGVFNRSRKEGSIFYVDRVNDDGTFSNVFVSSVQFNHRGVLVAKSGYERDDPKTGERYLVLEHGRRYEGVPGHADYRIIQFDRYGIRIERQLSAKPPSGVDSMSVRALLNSNDPAASAELHWRLAQPLSLFFLAMLALVFAHTDARRGRFANLLVAILVYFLYMNLLGIGQALMRQGRVPLPLGLWWVHALFAVATLYLFARRNRNAPLLPSWRPWRWRVTA